MPEISPRAAERARSPWLGRVAIGCAIAVMAAAAYVFFGAGDGSAATSSLRTATVARGNLDQTTTLTGNVARVGQLTVSFPSGGRVTTVKVAVGDTVKAGQVLATMDTADLTQSVTVAEADLVAAQAELTDAEATAATASASSPSTSTSASSATAASHSTSFTGSGGSRTGSGGTGGRAVGGSGVDARGLSTRMSRTQTLVSAVEAACAPLMSVGGAGDGGTPTTTASPTTTPVPTTTATTTTTATPTVATTTAAPVATDPATTSSSSGTPTTTSSSPATSSSPSSPSSMAPTADQVRICVAALGATLASEQDTSTLAAQLAMALDEAATALQTQAATATSTSTNGRSTGTGAGTTGSVSSSGSSAAGRGAQGGSSVADLEVSVLKAQQSLATTQQALAGATLTSPVGGLVGAISLVPAQTATTSEGITIVAPGTAILSATVPLAQLGRLRVGQSATVLPSGTTTPLDGAIQSIGVLPSSTTSTTPTYPVQVAVPDAPTALATGSQASATITLASVTGVLTVPVSALAGINQGTGSITVLKGSATSDERVTVGAIGQGLAQILTGLSLGQVVVLADASRPLPSANPLTARLGGRGGGFGGGGVVVRQGTTVGGAGGGAAPKG
ncbi:MAG: HlyD family efflux transporter periplasmic adaptor subunit [Nostocoides sp.]